MLLREMEWQFKNVVFFLQKKCRFFFSTFSLSLFLINILAVKYKNKIIAGKFYINGWQRNMSKIKFISMVCNKL